MPDSRSKARTLGIGAILVGLVLAVGGYALSRAALRQGSSVYNQAAHERRGAETAILNRHWQRVESQVSALGPLYFEAEGEGATGPRIVVPDSLRVIMETEAASTAADLVEAFPERSYVVRTELRFEPKSGLLLISRRFGIATPDMPERATQNPGEFDLTSGGLSHSMQVALLVNDWEDAALLAKYFLDDTLLNMLDVAGNETPRGVMATVRLAVYRPSLWPSSNVFDFLSLLFARLSQLGLLLLIVAPPVWVYLDARQKGLSGLLWALFVLPTSAVGALVYALASKQSGSRCPECGQQVSPDYVACPYCRTDLKGNCSTCGQTVSLNWHYCPNCSTRL